MSLLLHFRVLLAKNPLCLAVMPVWHSAFSLLEFRDCVTYSTVFPTKIKDVQSRLGLLADRRR